MTVRTIIGDCREVLKTLPSESVHCVVTSPPYWGLRDYGVPGQIGLEPTYQEHVAAIAALFDEVHRVLRKDGTLWLNYGDSYAGGGTIGRNDTTPEALARRAAEFGTGIGAGSRVDAHGQRPRASDLKSKDLCGIPWRVAFALQERGWWLRQDIIWAKPNPMPESIKDRCTKAHEYIFLLSKSERYYFDAEAISEPAVSPQIWNDKSDDYYKASVGNAAQSPRWNSQGVVKINKHDSEDPMFRTHPDGRAGDYSNRNRRSVWTIATAPFGEAHFATFPPELPQLCIKAGTKPGDTILDPFGGAGTTGLVADRMQRHAILIELNPEYAEMAGRRVSNDRGGLLDLMEAAQ